MPQAPRDLQGPAGYADPAHMFGMAPRAWSAAAVAAAAAAAAETGTSIDYAMPPGALTWYGLTLTHDPATPAAAAGPRARPAHPINCSPPARGTQRGATRLPKRHEFHEFNQ